MDPNKTPEGISLDEIREITQRNSDRVRFFSMHTKGVTIPIVALPTVYVSDDFGDSRYFAEKVPEFVHGRFFEIGCGAGVIAIAVAIANSGYSSESSETHVAIDINPESVKNTRINLMINGLEN